MTRMMVVWVILIILGMFFTLPHNYHTGAGIPGDHIYHVVVGWIFWLGAIWMLWQKKK